MGDEATTEIPSRGHRNDRFRYDGLPTLNVLVHVPAMKQYMTQMVEHWMHDASQVVQAKFDELVTPERIKALMCEEVEKEVYREMHNVVAAVVHKWRETNPALNVTESDVRRAIQARYRKFAKRKEPKKQ